MIKTIAKLAATVALAASAIAPSAAIAREGTPIGHGIKCFYVLGVQICRKGP